LRGLSEQPDLHRGLALEDQHPFARVQPGDDRSVPDPKTGKQLSKRKLQIRADGFAPYGFVQKVFEGCALAGIYKIELAAAKPMPE
jgi:hypothetical protein